MSDWRKRIMNYETRGEDVYVGCIAAADDGKVRLRLVGSIEWRSFGSEAEALDWVRRGGWPHAYLEG